MSAKPERTEVVFRASPSNHCEVCEAGTKGCSSTADGLHLCRGGPANPSAWKEVSRAADKAGFRQYRRADDGRHLRNGHTHHRRIDPKPVIKPKPKPHAKPNAKPNGPQTWREQVKKFFHDANNKDGRGSIAKNLGLPVEAFDGDMPIPGLGYTEYGTKDGDGAWVGAVTYPMVDGQLEPCAIQKRLDEEIAETRKYTMPGGKLGLIPGREFVTRAGPLLIPEGGSDVAALAICGLAAIGRPSNVTGAELLAEILADFPADRQIVVVGENDQKYGGKWPGKEGVDTVAPKLAALHDRPILTAYPPAEHKDCRDWVLDLIAGQAELDLAAIGETIRQHVESTAVPVQPGNATAPEEPAPDATLVEPLPLIYFDDITPVLDSDDFVEGLLSNGCMSVVYGDSGSGKTFWTLDLALHVALGHEWRFREIDRGGVLYLAMEGSHGIRNRVAAFKRVKSAWQTGVPFAIVPVAVNLLDSDADVGRVIEAAKIEAAKFSCPVRLIVVDTLSRAIAGGDENSAKDMTAYIGNIDRIRQTLPAHLLSIHHCGKDAAKGARGHGSLRAATDTEIEVTRVSADKDTARIAEVKKQRDLDSEGTLFAFTLEPVPLGENTRGKMVSTCIVRDITFADIAARADEQKREKEEEKEQKKAAETAQREQKKADAEKARLESDAAKVLKAIEDICNKENEPGKKQEAATKSKIRTFAALDDPRALKAISLLLENDAIEAIDFVQTTGRGRGTKQTQTGYRPKNSSVGPVGPVGEKEANPTITPTDAGEPQDRSD
jgi:RecA-family ATPase